MQSSPLNMRSAPINASHRTTGRLPRTPLLTHPVRHLLSASKGFGTAEDSNPNREVNERDKGSSRSGASPRKAQPSSAATAAPSSPPSTPVVKAPLAAGAETAAPSSMPRRMSASSSKPIASTPQVVVDRMFLRMVTCAAVPVVFGIALLVVFYQLKTAHKDDFPMWIVYVSQNLTFGGGLLGITYGILSTSWDPNREGSVLGWDEFRANLPLLLNRQDQGKK